MTDRMRRAVVVGNSDGIGLAFTRRLLADGWLVTGLSRRDNPIIVPTYAHHTVDVTAPDYPEVLSKAIDELGGVDLCVYAAGVGEPVDLADLDPQTRTFEVNLMGAVRTAAVVVPKMLAAGDGHLIGISSLADRLVSGEAPGYAGSKAGLSSYLMGLAAALRRHGVHVTTVRFGFVDTKMAKGTFRPLMIPVDRAVEVLAHCVRNRPVRVSRPRRLALLTAALAPLTRPH
ncbi:SDR family NAD(P)-dependent oxidoreductase [Verrucosispora sp. WMMA2044]|uniref:SDR family NAD(P)-dependent oxidoreductase n=1 Tax=Verrucosispora sioxanthis TaxID=2499994 RepID=A0A6M1L430_9ACTN|nr:MULTISPECIES: SDR family NAD(P)-dependent oxidoreductase [Micromonospora]NEE64647.1 SDR family NAD(P)-dependent oxidoreductase [Verrucosispora sioxanthis]NGM13757.1 SDR family NAD(P)-dependent oxidoreductase [Verrucosispora sioxanthis]WBB49326.1 SDR family NAD(P)-dependent oxidoreductase [Verrucosispora sp. WMMA2044]